MRRIGVILAVAFIAAILGASTIGIAAAEDKNESKPFILDSKARDELVAFVNEAKSFVSQAGEEKALKAFNDPKGAFVRGGHYIIAYDFNGTCLAHPYEPQMVGENVLNVTDTNGVALKKNMRDLARKGSGFTYYIWPNPAHSNADELKLTYVVKVDEKLWFGAGTYLNGTAPAFGNKSRENLITFVKGARDFEMIQGKDKALRAFNDPKGEFAKGELYIIAYDFNGTRLAHPYMPEGIGKNALNATDANGVADVMNMLDVAKRGSGFTYYIWPNPAHSNAEEIKLTYVLKIDDGLWLGSGIYAN
jgi:signal transduction histidine kinase